MSTVAKKARKVRKPAERGEYSTFYEGCVLSIDQSTVYPGLAIVDYRKHIHMFCSLPLSDKLEHWERRMILLVEAQRLVKIYQPQAVIMEQVRLFSTDDNGEPFISRDVQRSFDRMMGTLIDNIRLPFYSINTQTWKYHVLGKRNATKEYTVRTISQEQGKEMNEHEADAICIGIAAFNRNVKLYREW
jgi:Holliday junction resolvasome RuvABC endonuclease subunit